MCVSPSPSSGLFSTLRAITQTLPSCINAWLKGNFFWEVRGLLYVNFGKKHYAFPEYGYRRPQFSAIYAYLYWDTVNCLLVEHISPQECYVFTTSRKDLTFSSEGRHIRPVFRCFIPPRVENGVRLKQMSTTSQGNFNYRCFYFTRDY